MVARGSVTSSCAACASATLVAHLSVAGEAGPHGLIPTSDRYGSALADIVRCAHCGHMQLECLPEEPELEEAYAEAASEDYIEQEAGQRETARRVLAEIERFVVPGRIVDLGCWTGFLLSEARARGWSPLGVEPSAFAAAYAGEHLGLEVQRRPLAHADLPRAHFAAAVMGDVIEHLPHPGAELDQVADALVPGGVLCLLVPDAGSRVARRMGARWWSVLPTHVQYFTRSSLVTLLRRHGYEPLHLSTAPKAFTVAYYLNRLGGYSPAVARGLVAAASRLGLAQRMWAPDFRDRMLLIARAPQMPSDLRGAPSSGSPQRARAFDATAPT